MKAMIKKGANLLRSLEINGVQFDGVNALSLYMVALDTGGLDPLTEAANLVIEGRLRVRERISSEVSWQVGPTDSHRIDTVKGSSWFGRLVRDCLRSTNLQLPDDRLQISITEEIKDAMKGRVIRASLSTDPRSGRVRIEKRSIELVPLAQPVPQLERDMTPVQLEIL